MGSVELEHKHVTKLILVTFLDQVEFEENGFSSVEKDPIIEKKIKIK